MGEIKTVGELVKVLEDNFADDDRIVSRGVGDRICSLVECVHADLGRAVIFTGSDADE